MNEDKKFLDESKLMTKKDLLEGVDLFEKYALYYNRLYCEYRDVYNFLVYHGKSLQGVDDENCIVDSKKEFFKNIFPLINRLRNYYMQLTVLSTFSDKMEIILNDVRSKHKIILDDVERLENLMKEIYED
jgi:hypothetical protein